MGRQFQSGTNRPSMRKRIRTAVCGPSLSMWMSEAVRSMASAITVLTNLTRVLLDSEITSCDAGPSTSDWLGISPASTAASWCTSVVSPLP